MLRPVLYSPDGEGVDFDNRPRRASMPPYMGKPHYFSGISPEAEVKLKKLLDFFAKEDLHYYNVEGPVIRDESTLQSRYLEVTVSIKMTR